MSAIAVIPARLSSTRFPNKPLAKICGLPMIGHIYLRTKMAKNLSAVYVATCDAAIADYVASLGGTAIMTKDAHERATERVGEAIEKIEQSGGVNPELVVMVQGDEPLIHPDTLDEMVSAFKKHPEASVINLTNEITAPTEYRDKNIVKLVYGTKQQAVWFFREPSPFWQSKVTELPIKIQTGIIAFRREALTLFNSLAPTAFEKANSVDMSRLIEHGYPINILSSTRRLYSVDTLADLQLVTDKMQLDEVFKTYATRA